MRELLISPYCGELDELCAMFSEYTDFLVRSKAGFADYLKLQNYSDELKDPGKKYGAIFIARWQGNIAGCIALRRMDSERCELKRLYVKESFRGLGIGSALLSKFMEAARDGGYGYVLLDTFELLDRAIAMYRKAGFYEISSYNGSPMDDLVYMRCDLRESFVKRYSYALFDLDGTLTDSCLGVINASCYAMDKLGYSYKREELISFVGPPLFESFRDYCGISKEEAVHCVEVYREYYRDIGIFENELYPGIPELLRRLRESGIRTMVATSKPEEFAERILKHFGIDDLFDVIAGSTMDGSRINKDDVIRWCLSSADIDDVSDVVMIGDREYDVFGARNMCMDSVGVLYGYGDRAELQKAGATYIVHSVNEIGDLLLRRTVE